MDKFLAFFHRRRTNYRLSLMSAAGRQVLADLETFCCASSTTARGDAHEMAVREGRRQVWLRIRRALDLTPEQQFAIMSEKDNP